MRRCKGCGWKMDEGYLHEASGETYCSKICLDKLFKQEDQDAMTIDELFWTTWHDEVVIEGG